MSLEPTFQQKAEALEALSPIELCLDVSSQWYVQQSVTIRKVDGCSRGVSHHESTPEKTTHAHWMALTNLKDNEYISARQSNGAIRKVKWNGFMWKDVVGLNK